MNPVRKLKRKDITKRRKTTISEWRKESPGLLITRKDNFYRIVALLVHLKKLGITPEIVWENIPQESQDLVHEYVDAMLGLRDPSAAPLKPAKLLGSVGNTASQKTFTPTRI